MGALSKRNDDPAACVAPVRPGPRRVPVRRGCRRGGAGVARSMRSRAAPRSRRRCIGAALTADAFHISAPDPSGRGATRAMTHAPCATQAWRPTRSTTSWPTARPRRSTTSPRRAPSRPRSASTRYRVAISSPKSMVGHLLGAAGVDERPDGDRRHPRGRRAAHSEPARTRTCPSATWTTRRWWRARSASTPRSSTASGSAARTRSRSSGASRPRVRPRPRAASVVRGTGRRAAAPAARAPRPGRRCGTGLGWDRGPP